MSEQTTPKINRTKLSKLLWQAKYYTMSIRMDRPNLRAPKFKRELTDELLREWLVIHVDEDIVDMLIQEASE